MRPAGFVARIAAVCIWLVPASAVAQDAVRPATAPPSYARNSVGAAVMLPLKFEPVLEPAADGSVLVGGSAWEASPLGGEAFYARQVYAPTTGVPMEVAIELPLAYAPRIQWPAGSVAEVFAPDTGQSLGPAPDYTAVYFTPRVRVTYPSSSRLQFVVALGWGVVWISEERDGATHRETGYPVHYQLGAGLSMGPGWALRASFGGYGHMEATERGLYAVQVGLVRRF